MFTYTVLFVAQAGLYLTHDLPVSTVLKVPVCATKSTFTYIILLWGLFGLVFVLGVSEVNARYLL